MPDTPARQNIDQLEFPMKSGYGEADYLLYVDAVPAGVVEAKQEGETLTRHANATLMSSFGA